MSIVTHYLPPLSAILGGKPYMHPFACAFCFQYHLVKPLPLVRKIITAELLELLNSAIDWHDVNRQAIEVC